MISYTLHPFNALTLEGKPFEGSTGMSPPKWNAALQYMQKLYTAALIQLLLLRTLQVQNMKLLHKDAPLLTLVAPENSAASVITHYKVFYNLIHFSCVGCASKPGFKKTSERGINTPRCF